MDAQFEEKQYEQLLNNELGVRKQIFPTGQVFENTVGVDVALFSRHPEFWRLWSPLWMFAPLFPPKGGVHLDPHFWDELTSEWNNDRFPIKYKCNVFLQHKRPEYVDRGRGNELKFWRQPFYRYPIEKNQQDKLFALEQKVSKNALVLYSCPAFWKSNDLWNFRDAGKLVENSNFAKPSWLNGHHKYSFINRGKHGKAFSEPTEIPNLDLLKEIDKLSESKTEEQSNKKFIKNTASLLNGIAEESDNNFRDDYSKAQKYFKQSDHELARSLTQISAFLFVTGISWSIIYDVSKK